MSGPRYLSTVTRAGRPVALVRARDFADAVKVAARLLTIGPAAANDGKLPAPIAATELRARRPTVAECWRFAAAESEWRGEVSLAALPVIRSVINELKVPG